MRPEALSLLYRLLLAHFLADFPLQPNELYKLKTKSFWGSVLHGAVFGVLALLLSLRGGPKVWGAVAGLTVFHILVDHAKAIFFLRRGSEGLLSFCLDQASHIGAIVAVSLALPLGPLGRLRNFLLPDRAIVVASFLILSAFGGTIILYTLKRTLWPASSEGLAGGWREWTGVVERGLITGLVVLSLWALIPVVIASKGVLSYRTHLSGRGEGGGRWKFFLVDVLASAALATALGWLAVNLPVGR